MFALSHETHTHTEMDKREFVETIKAKTAQGKLKRPRNQ